MPAELRSRLEAIMAAWVTDEAEREAVLAGEPLAEAMNLDSMALLELVVRLEAGFDVTIDAEDIESLLQSMATIETGLNRLVPG